MKSKILIIAIVLLLSNESLLSQINRGKFAGTQQGELFYLSLWYEYEYMTFYMGLWRMTEYGSKAELVLYQDMTGNSYHSSDISIGTPFCTNSPGILFTEDYVNQHAENYYISVDYGNHWTHISEYYNTYLWNFINKPETLVKLHSESGDTFISHDFGSSFEPIQIPGLLELEDVSDVFAGWNQGEFFDLVKPWRNPYKIIHTTDSFLTADTINLLEDSIEIRRIYTGPVEGELYFQKHPNATTRKIDFSNDFGYETRTLAVITQPELPSPASGWSGWTFYIDREPGVFYTVRDSIEFNFPDPPPYLDSEIKKGNRTWIKYYRDYGETLVTTYFHDFAPDWLTHHSSVMDCKVVTCTSDGVTLHWNEPELKPEETLVGYQVYRGETLVNANLLTETEYTDAISGGVFLDYHILAVYDDGESSRSYNIVYCEQSESVAELQPLFSLHPNPTNGQVTITGENLRQAEVVNMLGQRVATVAGDGDMLHIDMAKLHSGVYFVNITDSEGRKCVRKVVKE